MALYYLVQQRPGLFLQKGIELEENPVEAYSVSHSKNNRGAKHECEFQLNPCIN